MAAGVVTAGAAIMATNDTGSNDQWLRMAAVASLGLALSVALTLLAEERSWKPLRTAALNAAGVAVLVLFYFNWPGPDYKHQVIRYFQLSAGLHLLVATLPFVGRRETNAFWQYNRRLFLGFLRATIFSFVLFVGLVIALVALDKLFGVAVPSELYSRLYLVVVFVINTGIFLAAVPRNLAQLADDVSYPRVLKVFAQYILTPLVFVYLLMLLAYLVKILAGGQWPSGWIGWLVTSVAIAGLLGFLLAHPLRTEAGEGWIRTYARWLFIGLIPAAVVLLAAFWKRVLPYGLTELRLLGILLALWLLGIAVSYTVRPNAGIRRIPVTLGALLLITLYGPISATNLSLSSQTRRLTRLVAAHRTGEATEFEASAALRFLLDHGARRQIAAAIPAQLPSVPWDSLPKNRQAREDAATRIFAAAGIPYVGEYAAGREKQLYLYARQQPVTPISGYDWMLDVSMHQMNPLSLSGDTVHVRFDSTSDIYSVRIGRDTLAFDVGRFARGMVNDPYSGRGDVPPERMRIDQATARLRGMLALRSLSGTRTRDSLNIDRWQGTLFLGKVD
jgi:hypothetical protein